jgi:hypothetical protein
MGSVSYKEKKTLPGLDANVPAFGCVTALGPEGPISAAEFWNINQIPFRSERGCRTIAAIDMRTTIHSSPCLATFTRFVVTCLGVC